MGSTGGGDGGSLGGSCRALVRRSIGTSCIGFLLSRIFLGMILLETRNESLGKEFCRVGIPVEEP